MITTSRKNSSKPLGEASNASWNPLFKIGGICALAIAILFLLEMTVYLVSRAPSLTDTAAWFALFHEHRFIGLLDFGILELYGSVLFIPVFATLYNYFRNKNESLMLVAIFLALTGIAANFATSKMFPLLTLSDLFASASTEALRAQYLVLGRSVLALGALGGISGTPEGGIPLAFAGLLVSWVMLRHGSPWKAAAIAGLLANVTAQGMYLYDAFFAITEGSPFFIFFFVFSIAWFVLIGLGLLRQAIQG